MGGAGLTLPPAARCARAECSLPERLRPAHILGYPEISWDYLRISQDVRLLTGNRGFVPVGERPSGSRSCSPASDLTVSSPSGAGWRPLAPSSAL